MGTGRQFHNWKNKGIHECMCLGTNPNRCGHRQVSVYWAIHVTCGLETAGFHFKVNFIEFVFLLVLECTPLAKVQGQHTQRWNEPSHYVLVFFPSILQSDNFYIPGELILWDGVSLVRQAKVIATLGSENFKTGTLIHSDAISGCWLSSVFTEARQCCWCKSPPLG